MKVEINIIRIKRTIQRIHETKSWFFEKINKINNPLCKLIERWRENIQIEKIRNQNEDNTKNT